MDIIGHQQLQMLKAMMRMLINIRKAKVQVSTDVPTNSTCVLCARNKSWI